MAYYNRFRDQLRNETQLPEDMSWESMSQGIYDKMGQKKKKRRLLLWWFLPAIVCGVIGTFWYLGTIEKISPPLKTAKQQKIIASENIVATTDDQTNSKIKSENTNTSIDDDKNNSIQAIKQDKRYFQNNDIHNSQNVVNVLLDKNKIQVQKTITSEPTSINENIQILSDPNDNASIDNIKNLTHADQINSFVKKQFLNIELLSLLQINKINTMSTQRMAQPEIQLTTPINNKKNLYFGAMDLMVSSGIMLWNTGSPSTLKWNAEQHNAKISEKELPSYSISVRNDISINKHFFVSSSLDYQRFYTEFNYDGSKVKTRLLDDVVLTIQENLISGEMFFNIGTANVNETETRTLRNRNEMYRATFSLMPGFQTKKQNWTFKISAGPYVSLITKGKGKTLWNGDVVTYDGDIAGYNQKLKLGIATSAMAKYHISERWFVHSAILYQKYLTNHSADPLQVWKPSLWQLSAGVGFSF